MLTFLHKVELFEADKQVYCYKFFTNSVATP